MSFMRRLRYVFETAFAYAVYYFFKIFPVENASAMGGFLLRTLGPKFGISKIARKNLRHAFPDKTEDEIEKIVSGMWDNLGRVIAEYPHLRQIHERVELVNGHYLDAAREAKTPSIFFAAHLANWEINAVMAKARGVDIHLVYRKPNNPWVDGLLRHARDAGAAGHIEKGGDGARAILSLLKKGGVIGMLMDQKLNEGVAVPFLGRDAMTAPAIAHFAMKFSATLYPSRIERLSGARFRMTLYPPLSLPDTGNREEDILILLSAINSTMESWIRAQPEQWLWIHRRWPD